ncbi:hypothetical protein DFJ74DRAFT_701541 [Hyaloraphidium curvatum]|nr:hypothetical protein DFJ74DRAFT_701541 [Hyaloraphidium curvatum]
MSIMSVEEYRLGADTAAFIRRLELASRRTLHVMPWFFGATLLSLHLTVPMDTLDENCFVFLGMRLLHVIALIFGTLKPRSILRSFAEFASLAVLARMWWTALSQPAAAGL